MLQITNKTKLLLRYKKFQIEDQVFEIAIYAGIDK